MQFLSLMESRRNRPGRYVRKNRATLVASMARGRRWLDELIAEQTATTDSIAKRERCSVRKVNMTGSSRNFGRSHHQRRRETFDSPCI